MSANRTRVVILGGGVAGLAAAWGLSDPSQKDAFDVTIYEDSWRLGGKAASGRNREQGCAIEERGLHVLMGSHDNAFGILAQAYAADVKAGQGKFATVWDAMVREKSFTVVDDWKGQRSNWIITLPEMPGLPGDGPEPPLWKVVLQLIEGLGSLHETIHSGQGAQDGLLGGIASFWDRAAHDAQAVLGLGGDAKGKPHWWDRLSLSGFHDIWDEARQRAGTPFRLALGFARGISHDLADHTHEHHVRVSDLLDLAWHEVEKLWQEDGFEAWLEGLELEARRALMILDLMRTALGGALRDGFLLDPARAARQQDDIDFRDWLKKHGALEMTREGPLVNMVYDLLLAYPEGDNTKRGDLAAGPLVQGLFVLARYRGSFFWKMKGGTGDIIAAPIYRELLRRGVRIEFFARAVDLSPSYMMDRINAVTISRRVRLKGARYDPLFPCNGLECWPSVPDYDQIVDGAELKRRNIDLESFWSGWQDTGGKQVLQIGEDYDVVVLAVPPEAARHFTGKLAEQKPEWAAMLDGVASCASQSVQLRFDRPMDDLGQAGAVEMVFGQHRTQLYGSASMDQYTAAECWQDDPPAHQSILVGGLPGGRHAPPASAHDAPQKAQAAVQGFARSFFDAGAEIRWPKAVGANGFDWSVLRAPRNATGSDRLAAQYMRANIDPSMRYVQSPAGTAKHRMTADGSLYSNLYLAGDWTDNPGNLGGMEYAIISGLLASRGISGKPEAIARVAPGSPYLQQRAPWVQNTNLPLFIEHNGMQTFPGPFHFEDVKAWAFFVRGDMEKMRALANRMFTEPTAGQMAMTPLSDMMMISFLEITKAGAQFSPNVSAEAEREMAIWMALGRRAEQGSNSITKMRAYCPYLVVDNPLAIMVGQTVYGYAKQPGTLSLPGDQGNADAFHVTGWGVRKDPMTEHWGFKPLMHIRPLGDADPDPRPFEGLSGLVHEAGEMLASVDYGLDPTLELLSDLAQDILQERLEQFFVKQIRDIVNSERAVLQGVTSAPIHFSNVKGVRIMRPHEVVIEDLYNTALCDTLGLPAKSTVAFGLEFTMDFKLGAGTVPWACDLGRTRTEEASQ